MCHRIVWKCERTKARETLLLPSSFRCIDGHVCMVQLTFYFNASTLPFSLNVPFFFHMDLIHSLIPSVCNALLVVHTIQINCFNSWAILVVAFHLKHSIENTNRYSSCWFSLSHIAITSILHTESVAHVHFPCECMHAYISISSLSILSSPHLNRLYPRITHSQCFVILLFALFISSYQLLVWANVAFVFMTHNRHMRNCDNKDSKTK